MKHPFTGSERQKLRRASRPLAALGALLLALGALSLLAACLPSSEPLPPLPTATPLPPTVTPTPTTVWFPPTATFTPLPTSPHVSPTVDLRVERGALILTDDFQDAESWELGELPAGIIALGKTELTIAIHQPGGYLSSMRRTTALKDYYVEVMASPSLCRGEDEYGLLLRVTNSNDFYRFSLNCQGQVRLDRYLHGEAATLKAPAYNGAVPPGAPSSSRLGVLLRGKTMQFFVNDQQVFTASDPSLLTGSLGFFARSNGDNAVTVNFSDLQIFEAE